MRPIKRVDINKKLCDRLSSIPCQHQTLYSYQNKLHTRHLTKYQDDIEILT